MRRIVHFTPRFLILLLSFLSLSYSKALASHVYGADLFYTLVSGNTYKISLVIYGDCNLTPNSAFSNLPFASPQVDVYNGSSFVTTVNLAIQSPSSGTEVTPVCASQLSNTTCVSTSGTVPGVKRFTYSANYNLGGTSANWRFYFNGELGSSGGQAGRSNSITNIVVSITNPSVMALEATLNNTTGANSSPTYTTIPTPFFCINKDANYNPGTVDANNDVLSYSLVTGLDAISSSGFVTYQTGYSATAPVASSGFTFNSGTGQLSFTPNLVQRSLVVTKVSEYRNSVLVGTSMREMTFVVLSNCNNNPPGGNISNVSGGTFVNNTNVSVCQDQGSFTFNINPTDIDGNNINVSASGIPSGASFTVTGNNTTAPIGSFSWNLAGVTPGTYNFFITYTDDGCPLSSKQTQAYTITVKPTPKITYALVSSATCIKKAVFTVTPSVAPSPWTLTILQGINIIHTITNITGSQTDSLIPGTYTFRVSSSNLCIKDTSITIAQPPAIIPSVSMVIPTCHGGSDGSITLTAGGGLSPFQYAINTGSYSSSNVFSGLAAGTYNLHIKDANDCIKDTTVVLQDAPLIDASITFVSPPCNYYNSGVITIVATSGTAPYQYALGAGSFSSTNTFSGLFSGNYTFHIKDANNCLRDTIFALPDSIKVHASVTQTNILCNSANTGAFTITANSATLPYKYKLGTGTLGSTNTFTNLLAGNHNVHIEDSNFCYLDTIVTLTEPTALTSTSVVTNVSCNGGSNGSITTTAAGGVSPYNYALDAGPYSSGNSFSGLTAGTYTVHIKDANNCLKDTTITITQPAALVFSNITGVEPVCNGASDGSYTVTAGGGTTPYTFAIDAGSFSSSNTFAGLAAGTYTLHIKDQNGCTRDSIVTLGQPTPILASAQVTKSVCTTLGNGKVVLSASGGVPPYVYSVGINPFTTSPTFTPLAAGNYFFHIKDSRGCVKDSIITIADSLTVIANVTVTNVACNGDTTGVITITGSGGSSPYTYAKGLFGTYTSNNVFNKLLALTYLIRIKDGNGCQKDTNVAVLEPTRLKATLTLQDISCNGFNDGKITVNGTGGTSPYTYALGTGGYSSTNLFVSLYKGSYLVRTKDNNGCTFDTTITLTEPPGMAIGLQVTDVKCFGDTSGTVTVTGTGGVLPYTYRTDYKAFQSGNVLTGINAGSHIIRLRDNNGCYKDSTILMNQPTKLLVTNLDILNPTCEGYADGRIGVTADGGISPYQYAANNLPYSGSTNITGLLPGPYTVHVKDNNGCISDTNVTLTGYPVIVINEVTPKDVSCFGFEDGTITVDAGGGMQPLSMSIGSKLPDANIFSGLKTGSYTVTITDSKNCKKDTTISVGTPNKLAVSLSANKNDCEGLDDGGTITSKVDGGTLPYSYLWNSSPVSYSADLRGMPNGEYKVIVTDAHECSDSATATIIYDNCCKTFIPDAFTPNNDGKNDKIHILFKGDLTIKQFSIFNRFGQAVFTTTNVNDGWDGVFNGTPQDIGTYNYYIKGICGNGGNKDVEYKGTITLIR